MLRLTLQNVILHRAIQVYSNIERDAKLFQRNKPLTFQANASGAIFFKIFNLKTNEVITAALDFTEAESGEHVLNHSNEKLNIFIERKGFVSDTSFNINALKQQAEFVINRYYPDKASVDIVTGLKMPLSCVLRYNVRVDDYQLVQSLLNLAKQRNLTQNLLTEHKCEAIVSLNHFCARRKQSGLFDTARTRNQTLCGDSLQLVHDTFLLSQHTDLIAENFSIVKGRKNDNTIHYVLCYREPQGRSGTQRRRFILDPLYSSVKTQFSSPEGPPSVSACNNTSLKYVICESFRDGVSIVEDTYENWLSRSYPTKPIAKIDNLVLDKILSTMADPPLLNYKFILVSTTGGGGKKITGRYLKPGKQHTMTGCRQLFVSIQSPDEFAEFNEYIIYS